MFSLNRRQVACRNRGRFAGIVAAISIALADPVSPVTLTNVDTPDPVASGAELDLHHHGGQHRAARGSTTSC